MPGGVRRFEDLVAWQKARELTRLVYAATREEPFRRDFGLCSQIQRASVSVMANIAEGFDRKRTGEFHQHLSVAKASCAEVRSHLYVALDAGYLDQASFKPLYGLAAETARVTAGLRASVERRQGLDGATQNSELRSQNSAAEAGA
jgi:four helix bundle protein